MHFRLIERYLGKILLVFGGMMGTALVMAVVFCESSQLALLLSTLLILGIGTLLFWHGRHETKLSIREGFAMVALTWALTSLLGALPFWLSGAVPTFIDALFESTSGLTATGATLITDVETLPRSLIFWRSLSQWLGGMGIIVLFIILLPRLGIGALNLFRAEAPGAIKEKVLPRFRDTAITLWGIYTGLTVLGILLLWAFGMPLFDAVNHGFTMIATGGFSTNNDSLMHYNSLALELIMVVFILIAAGNFSLYIEAWRKKSLRVFNDLEVKAFLGIILISTLIVAGILWLSGVFSPGTSLRAALFQVVSSNTGAGFVAFDYDQWPPLAKLLIFFLMFFGGMAGSTTGGLKISRVVVLFKVSWAELKRTIHPHMTLSVKVGEKALDPLVINGVTRFFFMYILVFAVASLMMTALGLEPFTAMGATAATLGNVGPAFDLFGPTMTYAEIPLFGKFILTLCMLLGRLELFTVLVLLQPDFWRSRNNW